MNNYNKILHSLNAPSIAEGMAGAVYFIGIGGIGMSALARYFNTNGIKVSGYDKTATPLTTQLISEGMNVHYEDDISSLDKNVQLVIYTPAIPAGHKELNYYKDAGYIVVKRSDVLGAITNTSFNICVAGTHGKTTTSTMVAHILQHSQYGCNAFLGGIAANYDSNYLSSKNNVCVIEADEYDKSFLKLSPDVAIITAMDPDHLDIYGTQQNVENAFIDFSKKLKTAGLLISKYGLSRSNELKASNHLTYHLQNNNADVFTENIIIKSGSYQFDVITKNWQLKNVALNMGGMHNIENIIAAIAVAHHLKIDDAKIKAAVANFKGVKRRFEYIIPPQENDSTGTIFIDDYAHHPEELKALITGAKNLFPQKKCTIIFQPHLYSRTKDFADGFAEALSLADDIILLPIYPARELPIEGVSSDMIINKIKNKNKTVSTKETILSSIKNKNLELLITAGAGDIDTLVNPIKQLLTNQN